MGVVIRVVELFCGIGNAGAGLYAAAAELGVEVKVVLAVDSWDSWPRGMSKAVCRAMLVAMGAVERAA